MKRGRVFPVCLLVMTLILAGCNPGADSESKGSSKKTVTVLLNTGFKEEYFKKIKPKFEKQNPDIEIKVIAVPYEQFDSKLSTLVAGGTPPDVWSHWADSGFADYYKRGLIADLTPYMDSFKNKNIPKKLMDIYNIDGKQYGIPFSLYTSFFYYNKEIFDQAGIPYPEYKWGDPEWNWDKVVELAKKLTKNYGKPDAVYGFTMNLGDTIDSYGWGWGADIYGDNAYKTGYVSESKLDDPKLIEAVRFFQDLIFKHKVSPSAGVQKAMTQFGDPFVTGKVAMNMTGGWGLGNYKKSGVKFGIAPIPTGPSGKAPAILYVDPLMISSKSKHPDAAWKLVQYMTSEEGQRIWAEEGYPPADAAALDVWYKQFKDQVDLAYLKELNEAAIQNGAESPNHMLAGYSDILTFLKNESQKIFLNNEDPEKVLKEMDPKFEAVLKKIREKSGK